MSSPPTIAEMTRRAGNRREGMTRGTVERSVRTRTVTLETCVHPRSKGCRPHVRLGQVTRSATDGIRCSVMILVIERQHVGVIDCGRRVEVTVTLKASDEGAVGDDRGGRNRQIIRGGVPAGGASGDNPCKHGGRTNCEPLVSNSLLQRHALAPVLGIASTGRRARVETPRSHGT